MDFFETVQRRRSVREFLPDPVPATVIHEAIDAALLAPNSSNMQTWEFYWVKDDANKKSLVEACLDQSAARTASELVVAVANPKKWVANTKKNYQILEQRKAPPRVLNYYAKLMPFIYGMQYLAPLKWLVFNTLGIFKPTPRHPWSYRDRAEVCIKSSALACENFMLAVTAQGFDTCPMEGFDERRISKLLRLSRGARIVMVIAVGKRSPTGVWGERIRFSKTDSVFEV